ncbi:hypothetical protein [Hyunsoonleella pacifica]|uniref:Uncharacterized protein n=1 Tax=Hyunsoonleella pacifica TaxID=1080224 RepID=A0A4Q9FRJ4_9FLAO|nr:hypothetical protein [Hyunsoonleella pacifica]TBN17883.1 hypothetical protein EYD46_06115 [Hyunsoonleella pacifica]GGD08102.1 hypothetical protein GCM10011368_07590 [Hyunsoonleella pacifica]
MGSIILITLIFSPVIVKNYKYWNFWFYGSNHYSIKENSFLWYLTIKESEVCNFPVIKPLNEVSFNYLGESNQDIIVCEVEYKSNESYNTLINEINDKLKLAYNGDVKFSSTFCPSMWDGRQMLMDTLYSAEISDNDCINISLEKESDNSIIVTAFIFNEFEDE